VTDSNPRDQLYPPDAVEAAAYLVTSSLGLDAEVFLGPVSRGVRKLEQLPVEERIAHTIALVGSLSTIAAVACDALASNEDRPSLETIDICREVLEDIRAGERVEVPEPDRVSYLTQTTLAVDETDEIVEVLRSRFPALRGPASNDICYATANRQNAVRAVARDAEVVLVAGSLSASMLHAAKYQNFNVAVYVPSYEVQKMKDPAWLETNWAVIEKQVKVDKVYLETHRDLIIIDDATLQQAKAFFNARGITTAAGIAYVRDERRPGTSR